MDKISERRLVTLVFADLCSSSKLAGLLEAEHYIQILSALRSAYTSVIPRHRGTVVQIQGDGLLACFGYPITDENDSRRAIEATLQLHDIVRDLTFGFCSKALPPLRLHSGIHSGRVLVVENHPTLGPLEFIGDTSNVASRLSDEAEPDEIVVSSSTLGTEKLFKQMQGPEQISLPGCRSKVSVCRLQTDNATREHFRPHASHNRTPLIGRSCEIEQIRESLSRAIRGETRSLFIVGEPGIGKTRLSMELLKNSDSWKCQVHQGYCDNHLGAQPLQPIVQILRNLFHDQNTANSIDQFLNCFSPSLDEYRNEYRRLLSLDDFSDYEGQKTANKSLEALQALFWVLSRHKTQILFIDDWQWSDQATRHIIVALSRQIRSNFFILVTSRITPVHDFAIPDAEILPLGPLNSREIAETVRHLTSTSSGPEIGEIEVLSGGNPLFIEEICHAGYLNATKRIGRTDDSLAWLGTLIETRVGKLAPEQKKVIHFAAVIGTFSPAWLLLQVAGISENDPIFEQLAQQHILYPAHGEFRFKHGITQRVVYDSIGLSYRQDLHIKIAEVLAEKAQSSKAETELLELLSYHYSAGGDIEKTAYYAERAGDKAMASASLDRAIKQYGAALEALEKTTFTDVIYGRWSSIVQRFAQVSVYDPSVDKLEILHRAVELAQENDDPLSAANTDHWLGYIYYALGDYRPAIRYCQQALDTARAFDDSYLRVRALTTLAQTRAAACQYTEALHDFDELIQIECQRYKKPPSPYSLACQAAVFGDKGEFATAHEIFDEALERIATTPQMEGSVLAWRSAVYYWQGRWREGCETARKALKSAEKTKSSYVISMSQALETFGYWMLQRSPVSLQQMIQATNWLNLQGKHLFISLNYGWLAEALTDAGRYAEARVYAARALRRARRQDRLGETVAYLAIARLPRHRNNPMHYLNRARNSAHARQSQHHEAVSMLAIAQYLADRHQISQAKELVDQVLARFEKLEMDWHFAKAQALRQQLGHT